MFSRIATSIRSEKQLTAVQTYISNPVQYASTKPEPVPEDLPQALATFDFNKVIGYTQPGVARDFRRHFGQYLPEEIQALSDEEFWPLFSTKFVQSACSNLPGDPYAQWRGAVQENPAIYDDIYEVPGAIQGLGNVMEKIPVAVLTSARKGIRPILRGWLRRKGIYLSPDRVQAANSKYKDPWLAAFGSQTHVDNNWEKVHSPYNIKNLILFGSDQSNNLPKNTKAVPAWHDERNRENDLDKIILRCTSRKRNSGEHRLY